MSNNTSSIVEPLVRRFLLLEPKGVPERTLHMTAWSILRDITPTMSSDKVRARLLLWYDLTKKLQESCPVDGAFRHSLDCLLTYTEQLPATVSAETQEAK